MKLLAFAQILMGVSAAALAQSPISTNSYQLQQLVNTSKQQLKSAKELLEYGKRDSDYLERSSRVLDKLSAGVERSIEKYQGTAIYEKALLKLQSDDLGHQKQAKPTLENSQQRFETFQAESVKANLSDLTDQQKLSEALRASEPGFVPKIQTQTQLGNWQANTRVSSQLTELLSAVRGLREDLNAKENNTSGLAELLEGAEIQNQKQREVKNHGTQ